MYNSNNGTPTPISTTLDELETEGLGQERPQITFIGHNMGNRSFTFLMPMKEFYDVSIVANERSKGDEAVAQRKLNLPHANKLAKYILKGLVSAAIRQREIDKKDIPEAFVEIQKSIGKQPYLALQPIICNLRDVDPGGSNMRGFREENRSSETIAFRVYFQQKNLLYVVDGQHRRSAMKLVFDFINEVIKSQSLPKKNNLISPKKGDLTSSELMLFNEMLIVASGSCTVQIDCHLGLGIDEERQLFHDLNNLGKLFHFFYFCLVDFFFPNLFLISLKKFFPTLRLSYY